MNLKAIIINEVKLILTKSILILLSLILLIFQFIIAIPVLLIGYLLQFIYNNIRPTYLLELKQKLRSKKILSLDLKIIIINLFQSILILLSFILLVIQFMIFIPITLIIYLLQLVKNKVKPSYLLDSEEKLRFKEFIKIYKTEIKKTFLFSRQNLLMKKDNNSYGINTDIIIDNEGIYLELDNSYYSFSSFLYGIFGDLKSIQILKNLNLSLLLSALQGQFIKFSLPIRVHNLFDEFCLFKLNLLVSNKLDWAFAELYGFCIKITFVHFAKIPPVLVPWKNISRCQLIRNTYCEKYYQFDINQKDILNISLSYETIYKLEKYSKIKINIDDKQIFSSRKDLTVAEAKLKKKFQSLTSIDQNTSISQPITWGEYQLFLNAQASGLFHSDAVLYSISSELLNQPVTGISQRDALWFCAWLSTSTFLGLDITSYD